MGKKEEMLTMLSEEKEIRENRIIAEKDGEVYVSFEDAAVLNSANSFVGNKGTGMRTYNRDGSLASTGKRVHAMPSSYWLNRYKVKAKKMYVVSGHDVDGYRLIMEQKEGRCHIKTIPCYVIARDENKNLYLEKVTTISSTEFLSEFTNELNKELAAEIQPLILNAGAEMSQTNEMPI